MKLSHFGRQHHELVGLYSFLFLVYHFRSAEILTVSVCNAKKWNILLNYIQTTKVNHRYFNTEALSCKRGWLWTKNINKTLFSFVDCGHISRLQLKNVDTNVRLYNDTKYNSIAEVDCKEGYYNTKQNQTTVISTTTMTCSSNGTWVNQPTCERKGK